MRSYMRGSHREKLLKEDGMKRYGVSILMLAVASDAGSRDCTDGWTNH